MPKVEKSKIKKTSGNIRKLVYDRTDINKKTEIGILDFLKLVRQEIDESTEKFKKYEIEQLNSQEVKKVVEETEEQRKESDKSLREFIESNEKWELEQKEARKHKIYHMDDAYWEEKKDAISSDKDKLIWIFQTIKKIKERGSVRNGTVHVGYSEIIVKPFFILEDFELEFNSLFKYINADKDFFRKHNMTSYNPRFELPVSWATENYHIKFYDFTDDFIKVYMRDKLGIKTNIKELPRRCIPLKSGDVIGSVNELTWLFNLLLKRGEGIYTDGITTAVRIKKIQEGPFSFFKDIDKSGLPDCLRLLLMPIEKDEEFFKKHNMRKCHPRFYANGYSFQDNGLVFFADFTDDFLKAYLEDEERLGMKNNTVINNGKTIKKIEILKGKSEEGRIKVYINGDYENDPLDFARNKKWGSMYELAKNQKVSFDKNFYDYFNYQQTNPLYATHGFEKTTILKEEDREIVPNIEIKLITKSKKTRQLKSA
jgi:hypothetical protein